VAGNSPVDDHDLNLLLVEVIGAAQADGTRSDDGDAARSHDSSS
jgi:hypothetical protein